MDNKIIELHILQNFAPANLNRDDTNSPKDCFFGGVRRARISSQCIKRAVRTNPIFKQTVLEARGDIGIRTIFLKNEFEKILKEKGEDFNLASSILELLPGKIQNDKTQYLFFVGKNEIVNIVETFLSTAKDKRKDDVKRKDEVKKVCQKVERLASDIALFGRMVADDNKMTKDASCQVAHAISVHRVEKETDFFTAVDDLSKDVSDHSGSGHLGNVDYNSSCFYRYSNINLKQLKANLGDDSLVKATVRAFIESSIKSIPTGKQNTFAAHNPPSYIKIIVRDDGQCWSLANAFEIPIKNDFTKTAKDELEKYYTKLKDFYGFTPIADITNDKNDLSNMINTIIEKI